MRSQISLAVLAASVALTGVCSRSLAQIAAAPTLVNYQGRLTNAAGAPVPDGSYSITVSLWDAATGGSQKWSETFTTAGVSKGLFSVLLNVSTAGVFNGANLWLQTQVGTDAAMTPREQIASVPFAIKANTVPDASVASTQLASDSLSLSKVSGGVLNSGFGNIGVGGPASGYTLDVQGGSNPLRLTDGTRSLIAYLGAVGPYDGAFFGTFTNHPLIFQTNNNINSILTTSGQWGLGTFTPTALLHLNGSAKMNGNNVFEFGADATKQADAGKIGYQAFSPDSLDIVGAGTTATNRKVKVYAEGGTVFTGEITAPIISVLGGSDVAEPYHVAAFADVTPLPGMVVTMDAEKDGAMRVASQAYDPMVGGIISGANGIAPGITLRQKGTIADGEFPVASVGRVWCYADADANGPISKGNLLTTSTTPGYAMRVSDHARADGAVIGKAMSSLPSGKGLVLVLVTLK